MSIRAYSKDGKTLYRVSARPRSKDSSIRISKSISGISNPAEARRVERRLEREAACELAEREKEGITWGELAERWEFAARQGQELGRDISKGTIRDYVNAIEVHTQDWWNRPAASIGRSDIRQVSNRVLEAGRSKTVCVKLRTAINAHFEFGIEHGFVRGISQSPAIGLKLFTGRVNEALPEILTIDEVRTLLRLARQFENPWFSVWALALHTGMRSGELFALRWSDLDLTNRIIHVHRSYNRKSGGFGPTKGRYWREVPINDELLDFLQALPSRSRGPFVLPRIRHWERGEQARYMREFCSIHGLPSVRFHTLRACWCTELLRQGVPIAQIMKMGGWSSMKAMERYVRLTGIDVKNATQGLILLQSSEVDSKDLELFNRPR